MFGRHRGRVFAALVIAIFLGACSSPRVQPVPRDGALSRAVVTHDLRAAAYALQTAYAGTKFLPEDALDNAISQLYSLSNDEDLGRRSIKKEEFCRRVAGVFAALPDPELKAIITRPGKEEICSPVDQTRTVAAAVTKSAATKRPAWKLESKLTPDGRKVMLLVVNELESASPESRKRFIQTGAELQRQAYLIVDLRGNADPDATPYLGWLRHFFAGVRGLEQRSYTIQTTEAIQARIAWLEARGTELTRAGRAAAAKKMKQETVAEQARLSLATTATWAQWNEDEPAQTQGLAARDYGGTVYVLMDRKTGNAAETLIDALSEVARVRKVGQPSAGSLHFERPGRTVLAESGIVLELATTYRESRSGFVGAAGLHPDLPVAPGDDALRVALLEIDR